MNDLCFYMTVGGFTIRFLFLPEEKTRKRFRLKKILEKQFAGFVCPETPTIQATIKIQESKTLELSYRKETKKGYLTVYRKESANVYTTYYTHPVQYRIILMDILTRLLYAKGGFIFHHSAVLIHDQAVLFTGPSGIGKTTTARLLGKRYPVISLDNGIVLRENGKFFLYQTPFYDHTYRKGTSRRYEIGKLYFLNQATGFGIKPLSDKEQVFKKLNRQILQDRPLSPVQWRTAAGFAGKIPAARLSFAKNGSKLRRLIAEDMEQDEDRQM